MACGRRPTLHPAKASLTSSVAPSACEKRSSETLVLVDPIDLTYFILDLNGHAPLGLCLAGDLQRATYTRRELEIDADHPTSPASCGLSQQPACKPCSGTAVESRSVSVLALCMFPGSLHPCTHPHNGRGAHCIPSANPRLSVLSARSWVPAFFNTSRPASMNLLFAQLDSVSFSLACTFPVHQHLSLCGKKEGAGLCSS